MSEHQDFNRQIIEEFRANGGAVGGPFEGMPMLLLHTVGAKSGAERVNPLAYQDLGGKVAVFASAAGSPKNPDWYHNVVASPELTYEIGDRTVSARARVASGDERTEIWERQKANVPGFADYEATANREIPVVVLEPLG